MSVNFNENISECSQKNGQYYSIVVAANQTNRKNMKNSYEKIEFEENDASDEEIKRAYVQNIGKFDVETTKQSQLEQTSPYQSKPSSSVKKSSNNVSGALYAMISEKRKTIGAGGTGDLYSVVDKTRKKR